MSGSSSGTISLVNVQSYKVIHTFTNDERGVGIRFVSVLKNDASFVFVDETNRLEMRSFDGNDKLMLGQPSSKVTCITPLGLTYILVGCENGELLLINYFGDFNNEYKHQVHSDSITQVKNYPNNDFLYFASGSISGCVKLGYITKTVPPVWCKVWSHDNIHPYAITALAFVPNSEDVVSGSYGNEVYNSVCYTYSA